MARRGRPKFPDILTPREWEVLALLRDGLSNPEIADRLSISREGAKYHVSEILSKLGLSSREEAARWQPEERRRWWAPAFAPVAWAWHKANVSSLAAVAGVIAVATVAGGAGLLIWGLVATSGDGPSIRAMILAGSIPTPCEKWLDVPIESLPLLPPEKRALQEQILERCVEGLKRARTPLSAEEFLKTVRPSPAPPTPTRGPPPPGVRLCAAADIEARVGLQGAGGNLLGGVTFANHGSSTCALVGTPKVEMIDPEGDALPVKIRNACPQPLCDPRFGVVVAKGQHAFAQLFWSNWCTPTTIPTTAARLPEGIMLLVTIVEGQDRIAARLESAGPIDEPSTPLPVGPRCDQPGSPSTMAVGPYELWP